MPKAKWDGLSADDIDGAESSEFSPYAGELPKGGVYRFTLKSAQKGQSSGGNDKVRWIWELDGSWKDAHKAFDGCPVFDHMPMMQSAAFRAKQIAIALGLTSREFLNMVHDDEGNITKIGPLVLEGKKIQAYINVTVRREEGYDPALRIRGYVAPPDGADATGGDDEKPAKGKGKKGKEEPPAEEEKPKKGKDSKEKGKKGKKDKDAPPF